MSNFWNLERFNDNIALIDGENKITYKEFSNISTSIGNNFKSEEKKLLFVLAENNIESIAAYIAALNFNTAVLLLDSNIDKELLDDLLNKYAPDFIWGPRHRIKDGKFAYKNYVLQKNYNSRKSKINDNLSLLLSTSGSTGSPKLVRLSFENLESNAFSIAKYLSLDETEKAITTLPLSYTYGLSIINSHFEVGASVVLTNDSVMQKSFWDLFNENNATSLAGVPYTYSMFDRLNIYNMELPSLRYLTQAGGKLNEKLVKKFANFTHEQDLDFYIMYGQTEATARMSYLDPCYNIKKPKSIGKAIPNGEFYLVDSDKNRIISPNTIGELVYKGPNVMMGYAYSYKDLAEGDRMGNTLETGDIAYFDEEEFYYIAGRKKRFIKLFGKRVNLDQIESFLKKRDFNVACGGEDNRLLIALVDNKEKKVKEVINQKFNIHYSVIQIINVDKIKRNESGKILYNELFKEELS